MDTNYHPTTLKLKFTKGALGSVARAALKQRSGARGLRAILENSMLDIMYELPSSMNIKEVMINEEVIVAEQQPLLMYQKEAADSRG